ncbi:MAG: zinc-binding dehydrogenase, partial [Streptomyces sp.]|nr:zinc-binding dehydrogenase [Streptomyces sp.]
SSPPIRPCGPKLRHPGPTWRREGPASAGGVPFEAALIPCLAAGPAPVGGPFQVVVNHVRLSPEGLARLTRYVADGGAAASSAGPVPEDPARGVRSASLWVRSDGAQLTELAARVDAGTLRIHVAARRPVNELAAVHADAAAGRLPGKTVVLAP